MRKSIISFVVLIMLLSLMPATYAVKFGDTAGVPKSYWSTFTAYENALQNGDPSIIAASGMKVIEYWLDGSTAEQCAAKWQADAVNYGYEINSVWSVSTAVSKQYEALGDIDNALRAFKISLAFVDAYKTLTPHIGGNPDDMEFARTELKNKIAAYDVDVDLYAELRGDSGDTSFHNAKFEPKTGLYFGEPAGASFITTSPKKPSSTLIYVLFESEDMESRVAFDLSENEKLGYSLSDYSAIEGAVSLRNNTNSEDLTAWAKPRMRQTYAYIPMLFPEVKAIYWFNVNVSETIRWDFAVSAEAKELYGTLTSSEYFIGKGGTNSPVTYKKLGTAEMSSNAVTLLTYAPFFTMENITIQYRLDGNWLGQSSDIPYRQSFNMSDIAEGQHKLSVIVFAGETQLKSLDYSLFKNDSSVTISAVTSSPPTETAPAPGTAVSASPTASSVLVNGVKVDFDAYNIGGNNYFKLRDIGQALNFGVDWNEENRTVEIDSGKGYSP